MGATNNHVMPMPKIRDFAERIAFLKQQIHALDLSQKATGAVRKLLKPLTVHRIEQEAQAVERVEQLATLPLPEFTAAVPREEDAILAFLNKYVTSCSRTAAGIHIVRLHSPVETGNPYGGGAAYAGETLEEAVREAMRCNPHLK